MNEEMNPLVYFRKRMPEFYEYEVIHFHEGML